MVNAQRVAVDIRWVFSWGKLDSADRLNRVAQMIGGDEVFMIVGVLRVGDDVTVR